MTTAPKYYVETEETCTYDDSDAERFHHGNPHDTIDDAKAWAIANPGQSDATIYECVDNVIKPILIHDKYEIGWREYDSL